MSDLNNDKYVLTLEEWDAILEECLEAIRNSPDPMYVEVHEWTKPDIDDLEEYDSMFLEIYAELHDGLNSIQ